MSGQTQFFSRPLSESASLRGEEGSPKSHFLIAPAVWLVLMCLAPAKVAAMNGFVNDFQLSPSNVVSGFSAMDAEADTLGNVYVFWKNTEEEGHSILQKRSEAGELVWQRSIVSPGFDYHTSYHSVSVATDQRRVAIAYGAVVRSDNRRKGFVVIFDSSGNTLVGPLWVDSLISPPTIGSGDVGDVVFRGDGGVSVPVQDTLWSAGHLYVVNFDSSGTSIGPPIRVDTCSGVPSSCWGVQLVRAQELPNGGFVVCWDASIRYGTELGGRVPLYRLFDSNGQSVGPVRMTTFDSLGAKYQCLQDDISPFYCSGNNGDVAVAEDGRFIIGWHSCAEVPQGWPYLKIEARVFDIAGNPVTHAFLVTDTISNSDLLVPHAGYGRGHFYLIWTDSRNTTFADGRRDTYGQKISLAGELVGPNYRLNDPAFSPRYNDENYAITAMRTGILSLWEDLRLYPDSGFNVYGQIQPDSLFGVYRPGDVVVDYSVDTQDIISMVNYIFKSGQPAMGGKKYSDISGDCTATAVDIILLVNYVFKSGPPPLPPCE